MKYMTATWALMGGIANIEHIWNIACLFSRQTVSEPKYAVFVAGSCGDLPATNTAYLVGLGGCRKWNATRGELQNLANCLRNLEQFVAENCGPELLPFCRKKLKYKKWQR